MLASFLPVSGLDICQSCFHEYPTLRVVVAQEFVPFDPEVQVNS